MSATNRKRHVEDGRPLTPEEQEKVRKRLERDAYITPSWPVRSLLANLELPGWRWLEPCAGNGSIVRSVRSMRSDVKWSACEIREECRSDIVRLPEVDTYTSGDFLDVRVRGKLLVALGREKFDVILTNPPFSLTAEFVNACLPLSDNVIFLQRLNFLGGAERASFWRSHMPDIYILPVRPSFVAGGGSDATEYAWFHWHGMAVRSESRLTVLPLMSLEERKLTF